jgi:fumarate hydratase class II
MPVIEVMENKEMNESQRKLSMRNKLCRLKLLTKIFGCTDFGSGCNSKQCALSQIILLPYTIQKTHLRISSASLKFQSFSCTKIVLCSHSSFGKHACKLFKWHFNGQGHLMRFLIFSCMLAVMF